MRNHRNRMFLKRTGVIALSLGVLFGCGSFANLANGIWNVNAQAAEAEQEYTYTVFVYAGKEGYFFNDPTQHVYKKDGLKYGEQYTINLNDLDMVVENPDQYYIRGMKLAGHDNDEVSARTYQSITFTVEEDTSFSVAYGMTGGMVQYTVNYVDESGNALLESETYYGMVGDKPVVSYHYVEGYRPNAYNQGKTLLDDEAQNVITFTYTNLNPPVSDNTSNNITGTAPGTNQGTTAPTAPGTNQGTTAPTAAGTPTGTAGTGNTAVNGAGNTGAAGTDTVSNAESTASSDEPATSSDTDTDIGDDSSEPEEYLDLDEAEVPLAQGPGEEVQEEENGSDRQVTSEKSSVSAPAKAAIGIVCAVVVIALILLWLRSRKNRK